MTPSRLLNVYLMVQDMELMVQFYSTLLQKPVQHRYEDRWVQFEITKDFTLGLYRPGFDQEFLDNGQNISQHYDVNFISQIPEQIQHGNSHMLNFYTPELKDEYARIQSMEPQGLTEISYVEFSSPYYCFWFQDPEGNWIEMASHKS